MELKWIALIALILQNSGLAVVMRYTFILAAADPNNRYISSTAVLVAEILKLFIAGYACWSEDAKKSKEEFRRILYSEFVDNRVDFFKLMIPSFLYTVQNSLQYFSMSCLSAPVFQVLYQMKIITTAVFSVLLLSKRITSMQWIAILALAVGVALVQLSQTSSSSSSSKANQTNSVAGLVSVMCGCLTSGFAGVYFEMVLKGSKASIWLRNIQLSVIGIALASLSCLSRDGAAINERGFFVGYGPFVIAVIVLQAAGGLLVAMVVKYADNVLKGFATSLSIVLSALVSAVYFKDMDLNQAFVVGSAVVLSAVYMYGYTPPNKLLPVGLPINGNDDDNSNSGLLRGNGGGGSSSHNIHGMIGKEVNEWPGASKNSSLTT